ncbi:MAG: response regulator transcription factor [Chloroflexota bacterium]|nr:response regulator transcription factor [Chloroflexota bacterium]
MDTPHIRLVIVDDHSIVREGLCSILNAEPDFQVVGEASNGEEALRVVERARPDVVLLDLKMPGAPGADVCRDITAKRPETAVIILTAFLDSDMIYRCIQAGAKGYVVKDVERADLKRKIRAAARGEGVLDEKAASPVLERLRKGTAAPVQLTEREVTILRLIAEGLTNKEIGAQLYLSEATVKDQLRKIMDKFGVEHRISAVIAASKQGLI